MSYGTIKVNTITFTNNGVDQSVTVSGIVASTSGNLTVTGTVSGSTASFANGIFNTFSGGTCTITSGVLASGTASNPAISFNGDVNTGIYSPNANEIAFTTNGQARFIIDANGQLEASSGTIVTTGDTGTVTSAMIANGTIVNDDISASAAIADGKLGTISTAGKVSNSATTATSVNTPSAIVARDGSGNFTANVITASLTGNVTGNVTGNLTGTASAIADGTVTSDKIVNGTIVDADISNSAEIAVSKLADGSARQLLQTDAAGTGVEWTSNVDIPGTLDVTGATTLDSILSVPLGSATAPSIYPGTDINTGIYSPGADQLAFSTNGIGRLFINDTGQVSAGSTSTLLSTADFSVIGSGVIQFTRFGNTSNIRASRANGNASAPTAVTGSEQGVGQISFSGYDGTTYRDVALVRGSSNGSITNTDSSGYLSFFTTSPGSVTAQEKARITSNGQLLIGTSSARGIASSTSSILQVETTSSFALSLTQNSNDASGPVLSFGKSRGGSAGGVTGLESGDDIGAIVFAGADDTDLQTRAATIVCEVDGTPSADDMPGRLVFSTTADGASSPTEALRITNDRVIAYNQAAPVSKSTAATLTIAELKGGIIEYTGNAQTLTLPTGTSSEGGFSGLYNNMTFQWSVINTGSGTCTVAGDTGHTVVGAGAVAAGSSGRFASRRTGANTFVTYRLS